MGSYTSTTRITGLSSGLDVDSLVQQMMSAQESKYKSLQRKQTKTKWQQTAYRSTISTLQTFQDTYLGSSATSSNIRFSKAFNNYTNTVSTKSGATSTAVTINSSTKNGKHTIEKATMAQTDTYKGKSSITKDLVGNKTIDEITDTLNSGKTINFSATFDGTTKKIELSQDDLNGTSLVDAINSKLKTAFGSDSSGNAKVVAENSSGYLKFNVQADNGVGHTLTLYDSTRSDDSISATGSLAADLFDSDGKTTRAIGGGDNDTFTVNVEGKEYTVKLSEIKEGTSKKDFVSALNNALKKATTKETNSSGAIEEKTVDISGKFTFSTTDDGDLKITSQSSTGNVQITDTGVLGSIADTSNLGKELNYTSCIGDLGFTSGDTSVVTTSSKDKIGTLFSNLFTGDTYSFKINDTEVELKSDMTLGEMIQAVNNSGAEVTLSYNSITKDFTLESNNSGLAGQIQFDSDAKTFMNAIGINVDDSSSHTIEAKDAEITIDGVTTTRSSNTINVDGLNITINQNFDSSNGDEVITLESKADTDATKTTITNFVNAYNDLIKSLNSTVTESKSKTSSGDYYYPLLDDEKKEMSENEISNWETEAKKGLLKGDSAINSVLSNLRSSMYKSVTLSDGTKLSLYQIGITTTSDYTQGGKLEIDEEKLTAAIEKYGDQITELFTQTGTGIADSVNTVIKGAIGTDGSLRNKAGIEGTASANSNILSDQIDDLADQIAKEKERLQNKETYYYNLFSKMESAINNNNNQLDSISSLLS